MSLSCRSLLPFDLRLCSKGPARSAHDKRYRRTETPLKRSTNPPEMSTRAAEQTPLPEHSSDSSSEHSPDRANPPALPASPSASSFESIDLGPRAPLEDPIQASIAHMTASLRAPTPDQMHSLIIHIQDPHLSAAHEHFTDLSEARVAETTRRLWETCHAEAAAAREPIRLDQSGEVEVRQPVRWAPEWLMRRFRGRLYL